MSDPFAAIPGRRAPRIGRRHAAEAFAGGARVAGLVTSELMDFFDEVNEEVTCLHSLVMRKAGEAPIFIGKWSAFYARWLTFFDQRPGSPLNPLAAQPIGSKRRAMMAEIQDFENELMRVRDEFVAKGFSVADCARIIPGHQPRGWFNDDDDDDDKPGKWEPYAKAGVALGALGLVGYLLRQVRGIGA